MFLGDTVISDSKYSTVTYTEPLPAADSPTADLPGYILESNLEEDPADYPADGGDDDCDPNSSSSSEIAKLTHAVNQQTSAVTTAMTAILKQFQATPPPAFIKAVEQIYVTWGGSHPYYQCLAADGKTLLEIRVNIQGYVSASTVNYNQGNSGYRPPVVPLSEYEKIKKMNEINMKAMKTKINNVKNELRNEMKTLIQASMSNQTNELKNMMASFFQMNIASTLGLRPLPSNTISNPKGKLKAITTRSGIVLDGPSVPMPHPFINSEEDERVEETLTDPELGDFTIKVLPPLVQKAKPPSERNYVVHQRDPLHPNIPYPSRMHKQKQQKKMKSKFTIGKFTFPADFVIFYYERDPRVLLILGGPFLRISLTLIDVHDEEMILRSDYLKDLFTTNHLSGNPTFSFHTDLTSPEVKVDIFDLEGDIDLTEKLINLDYTKDLHPPYNINPLSGSTTSSSPNQLLEKFADELALITFPPRNDDLPIQFIKVILQILMTILLIPFPKMFTDEHTLDYSSPLIYDDLDEFESDNDDVYNDPFDSKEEKINESKLLIDELDLPRSSDFLPFLEYDLFLFMDFFEVYALPSTDNKDKVFIPCILIHENLLKANTHVAPDKNVKKIAISYASLIHEDFDPPLYELLFHKEVPGSKTLLSFSFKNEEKVFKPKIVIYKGVHSSLLPKLSHRGTKAFKSLKLLKARWRFSLLF
nr:hypothetical protein [Tanacetum cinerariifolium]